jgi:hypothetical protein
VSVSPASSAGRPSSTTQNVAGYLATASIFIALIGITYRPVRIIPAAVVLALIATGMGTRNRALGIAAVAIAAASFVCGMTAAVLTGHPLW